MKVKIKYLLIHVLSPLFLGVLIYVLFRSENIRFTKWVFHNSEIISELQAFTVPYKVLIPEWSIYSLPDGLWAYAFSALILKYQKFSMGFRILLLLMIPFYELAQLFGFAPGTFDILDLLIMAIAVLTSFYFNNLKFNNNENQMEVKYG